MKKRTLSLLFIAILACACIFTFAACNGDGNDHTHAYTETVTPATCAAEGYTTHTCACGDSFTDAPTSKLAHTMASKVLRAPTTLSKGLRSSTCSVCGHNETSEIEVIANFKLPGVAQALSTMLPHGTITLVSPTDEPIVFTLTEENAAKFLGMVTSPLSAYSEDESNELNSEFKNDFEFVDRDELLDKFEETIYWDSTQSFTLALTDATFTVDGENVTGQLALTVLIAGEDPDAEPAPFLSLSFYLNNENIAVELNGDRQDYLLSDLFYEGVAGSMNMTKDQLLEMAYLAKQSKVLLPLVESLATMLQSELPEAMEKIPNASLLLISILNTLTDDIIGEEVDGNNVIYTIHPDMVLNALALYADKSIAAIIDEEYGQDTTSRILSLFVTFPDKTIGEITSIAISLSEAYEIDLDLIYMMINAIIYNTSGTDFNFEAEILNNANVTLGALLEQNGADITELESALDMIGATLTEMTLADLVHASMCAADPECEHTAADCTALADMLDVYATMLQEALQLSFTLNGEDSSLVSLTLALLNDVLLEIDSSSLSLDITYLDETLSIDLGEDTFNVSVTNTDNVKILEFIGNFNEQSGAFEGGTLTVKIPTESDDDDAPTWKTFTYLVASDYDTENGIYCLNIYDASFGMENYTGLVLTIQMDQINLTLLNNNDIIFNAAIVYNAEESKTIARLKIDGIFGVQLDYTIMCISNDEMFSLTLHSPDKAPDGAAIAGLLLGFSPDHSELALNVMLDDIFGVSFDYSLVCTKTETAYIFTLTDKKANTVYLTATITMDRTSVNATLFLFDSEYELNYQKGTEAYILTFTVDDEVVFESNISLDLASASATLNHFGSYDLQKTVEDGVTTFFLYANDSLVLLVSFAEDGTILRYFIDYGTFAIDIANSALTLSLTEAEFKFPSTAGPTVEQLPYHEDEQQMANYLVTTTRYITITGTFAISYTPASAN